MTNPTTDRDNFSNAPFSINELKATKHSSASHWGPRDVLVSMLREIDNGRVNPDALVLIYHVPNGSADVRGDVFVLTACKGFLKTLGLIARAKWIMQNS